MISVANSFIQHASNWEIKSTHTHFVEITKTKDLANIITITSHLFWLLQKFLTRLFLGGSHILSLQIAPTHPNCVVFNFELLNVQQEWNPGWI